MNFSANYTFSKTLDDASDFDEQPQNPFLTKAERALSRNQQKHRFVLSGLWELPSAETGLTRAFNHIEPAPIFTIGSGRPVNPLTGLDSNRSGAWHLSARPLGFARNSLSIPLLVNMDFRINRAFPIGEHGHLSLLADFFNMFNRRNVIQLNPIFGSGCGRIRRFRATARKSASAEISVRSGIRVLKRARRLILL